MSQLAAPQFSDAEQYCGGEVAERCLKFFLKPRGNWPIRSRRFRGAHVLRSTKVAGYKIVAGIWHFELFWSSDTYAGAQVAAVKDPDGSWRPIFIDLWTNDPELWGEASYVFHVLRTDSGWAFVEDDAWTTFISDYHHPEIYRQWIEERESVDWGD